MITGLSLFLYTLAFTLLVYVIVDVKRTWEFKVSDALAALGIVVTIILASIPRALSDEIMPTKLTTVDAPFVNAVPNDCISDMVFERRDPSTGNEFKSYYHCPFSETITYERIAADDMLEDVMLICGSNETPIKDSYFEEYSDPNELLRQYKGKQDIQLNAECYIEFIISDAQPNQMGITVISHANSSSSELQSTAVATLSSAPVLPTASQTPLKITYEVFANLSWQNTGILIDSDDQLRIIWDGNSKWRGTNIGDFSDPLGGYIDISNPEYTCQPLMPHEEAGWNALVAKIGDNGTPTNPFKNIPTGRGLLYLAMNDCDSQRYDNEGSVSVTIEKSD